MFAPHWTVKAEYLYCDLGSVTYGLPPIVQTTAAGVPFYGGTAASHVALHIYRRPLTALCWEYMS
jgi:hypothetical protein